MRHLAEIVLENFKCFRENTSISLAPLTLLFGANSAGKSSIIQALEILKYCGGKPKFDYPRNLRVSYRDFVHNRSEAGGIRLGLAVNKPTPTIISWNAAGEADQSSLKQASPMQKYLQNVLVDELGPLRETKQMLELMTNSPDIESLTEVVNADLAMLDISYRLVLAKMSSGTLSPFFAPLKSEPNSSLIFDTSMVGYGINQIVPIIACCRYHKKKVVTIQQPELHLHPRLQTELGTLFVDVVKHQKNQLIIETHSEHILLRIQRLIRRGDIAADDVSLVYIEPGFRGSTARRIALRRSGALTEWPTGFLADRADEIYGD